MLRTLLIALVLVSGVAHAAGLPELRARVSSASARLDRVSGERRQLEQTLGEVARRIEQLKAEREPSGAALFGDAELDGLLRRSQELSARLNELLRAEREADEALRAMRAGLSGEIDRELARLGAEWDASASREARRALIPRLRALRGERDALRGALPSSPVPAIDERPTEDPEVLLERADALLDSEDKLRREERALAERIRILTEERELERRMHEFLGEEALFDDHDRRISISRGSAFVNAPAAGDEGPPEAATPPPLTEPGSPPDDGRGTFDGPHVGSSEIPAPPPSAPSTPGRQDPPPEIEPPRSGFSRMPPERRNPVSPYSEDESIEQLEVRRRQLRALADELHRKAEEAARQARELW
jgi:hypothetical protein